MYDKLVTKVNNIDISWFVLKTKYYTDKSDLKENQWWQTKNFLILLNLLKKKTDYKAKIIEIEGKIPSISF